MQEITVVTDVRLNPDGTSLAVVRQSLRAEGGELRLVGAPSEGLLRLTEKRAAITFVASADSTIGFVVVARVRNTSLVPFEISRVDFEYRYPTPKDVRVGGTAASEVGGALSFVLKDRRRAGPLAPGGTQDWYLPMDFVGGAADLAGSLPAEHLKVVAYSGNDPVGEGDSREFVAVLSLPARSASGMDRVRMKVQMRHAVEALPPLVRQLLGRALGELAAAPPGEWPRMPGVDQLDPTLFAVSAMPDYRAMVKPLPTGGVELLDIIRAEVDAPAAEAADAGAG